MRTTRIVLAAAALISLCPSYSLAANDLTPQDRNLVFKNTAVVANELNTETDKLRGSISSLLAAKKYDELDALATKLRRSHETTSTGRWKLDYFYSAFLTAKAKSPEIEGRIRQVGDWIKTKPNSVTAKVAMAAIYSKYAWAARGGGFADKVSSDGWRLMKERDQIAIAYLNEARKLPDTCPRWWYVRLQIARDESEDDALYKAFFKECQTKYPNYKTVSFCNALNLQPRWGGKDGEWETFITQEANKLAGIEGDKYYAQMVWAVDLTHWYRNENMFKSFRLDYPRVKRGFEKLLAENPSSLAIKSVYCELASRAGDRATAIKMFKMLGGQVDQDAWINEGFFSQWRNYIVD